MGGSGDCRLFFCLGADPEYSPKQEPFFPRLLTFRSPGITIFSELRKDRDAFMTLLDCPPAHSFRVQDLDLPLELARRLEALGLIAGSRVDVLRKKRRGAMIITVRGTRFAVGRGIAAHITVRGDGDGK